ncbi:hypothetical protein BC749_11030 [Flavobacterium araucananum]|uniref:Uncharacterized protein n=1 Tax=Flavobacterium araucananum TaxID=946678 RepID=A0A227NPJ0_9FLAO|nr:hypothetical protein B0A64_21340 [Flavobacterium araucananum]PWJ96352.1 hypothetical protein BC749_11030 [Flavobacterium araucananum]
MLFFLLLLSLSCRQNEEQTLNQIQERNKVDESILKIFTFEDVARYTMASIMEQQPKIALFTKCLNRKK